jgi:hypothetical protein
MKMQWAGTGGAFSTSASGTTCTVMPERLVLGFDDAELAFEKNGILNMTATVPHGRGKREIKKSNYFGRLEQDRAAAFFIQHWSNTRQPKKTGFLAGFIWGILVCLCGAIVMGLLYP